MQFKSIIKTNINQRYIEKYNKRNIITQNKK